MKKAAVIFAVLLITRASYAQIKSFGLIAGGGATIIDVARVVSPDVLSNWNTWGMVVKGFVEFKIGEGKSLGLEAGRNRLYYWEYPAAGYSWYNWRNEWTTNAVFYFSRSFGNKFYLQTGAGVHFFYNGTVLGIMGGAGKLFSVSDKLDIPVFIRIEPIFGNSTPIAINVGTGIKYNLIK